MGCARGLGMSEFKMMTRIILPQAFKVMVPPFMNQSIMQLKNTSLISTLAVADLVCRARSSRPRPIGRSRFTPWSRSSISRCSFR